MKEQSNIALKILSFIIIVLIAGFFLYSIPTIVKLVIIAALIAYILDPLANLFESRGMSRTGATIAIFIGIVCLIVISYTLILPLLLNEIKNLKTGFSAEQTISLVAKLEKVIISNLSFLGIAEIDLTGKLQETLSHTGEWIFSHVLDAASVITSFILIPFIVFFLLKDGREFKKSFINIVPNRYFEFTLYLFYKLNAQIGNFLRGQFIDAAIVGLMATLALWLVGLKYYFLIGLFTGIANLIPYFGPLTGAVLATILSIIQTGGLQMAAYVLLAFVIIKLLDDAIVQPVVVAKSVHMNPLTVLLVILIGGKWFGILGMLLSVPVTGFLKVVFHESIQNYRRYRA
ncbi:MAG: AI-2E family transporter [Nitrospirae bacterium]|nr:AI-2E family transporter [Nitrospirota bacterium]